MFFRTETIHLRRGGQQLSIGCEAEDATTIVVDADDVELAPTHWVYRSFRHHSAKTHAAGCANCRDGAGKKGGGGTVSGEWLPFYRLEDAMVAAETLAPERHSICNMCIGEYRKLGSGR